MSSPSVSYVIPTLNAERTLADCLASIRAQDYDGEVEIVLADGGSSDRTLEIAREHGVEQVVENPGQTGETGKAVGANAARGEILAFVDSDNVLVGRDWTARMVAPFADPEIVSSEALRWEYSQRYGLIDRYCALTGVNDPASIFIGNYGRYSHLTRRWTGFPVEQEQADGYIRVRVDPQLLPTMGANGYLVRADVAPLDRDGRPPLRHRRGRRARPARATTWSRGSTSRSATSSPDVRDFARKTRRRARDYLYYAGRGERTYPWGRYRRGLVLFVVATVTTVPVVAQSAVGYARQPDRAWWFHPVACWTTLTIYGWETLRARAKRERLGRGGWRQ